MRSEQSWNYTDPPDPAPNSPASWTPNSSPHVPLLLQEQLAQEQLGPERQQLESPTCYELQEQWLLVKQKYNTWQPRCIAYPAFEQRKLSRVQEPLASQTDSDLSAPSWLNGQFPAFEWCLVEWPTDSYSRLSDTDTLTPCLILDQPGQYRVRFIIGPEANHQSDRPDVPAVPAIVSDLTITAYDSGSDSVAIALADFTVKNVHTQAEQEPYLFLVAVYAGLTYL